MASSSESIFTPSKKQEDIRHDVDVVQKCWSQERTRRFKRALTVIIPLVALPLLAYVILAAKFPQYRLSRISDPPVPEEMYEEMNQENTAKEPVSIPSAGNPDAKLVISVIPQLADKVIMDILYEAVDAKPSEIFLKTIQESSLTEAEIKNMKYMQTCNLEINGKTAVELAFPSGKTLTASIGGPVNLAFKPDELRIAISQTHEKLYGKPAVPIFLNIKDISDNVEKTIVPPKPRKKTQTFDFLNVKATQTVPKN